MATIAVQNITDNASLTATRYLALAQRSFAEMSKLGICVSSDELRHRKSVPGAKSYTINSVGNLAGAITSATNPGSDTAETTPTDSPVEISWSDYTKLTSVDQASLMASYFDLIDADWNELMSCAWQTYDYWAAYALRADATSGTYRFGAATERALITDIVAGDTLTMNTARLAYAKLKAAKAPPFVVPGFGETYIAVVHSHAAHDLKIESSGLFDKGPMYVNAPNYIGNVLGHALGFLWIESNAASLLQADAGSGGTVDVYHSVFMGDRTLAQCTCPVKQSPASQETPIWPDSSMVVRLINGTNNLGKVWYLGVIMQLGFGLANAAGKFRVSHSSSLGTNT